MEVHPDGNITKYVKTKSKECATNNRTLITLAKDGSVSFIHMDRPMNSILLYPDQVAELIEMMKKRTSLSEKTSENP
jgi:hypothetical protein